MPDYISTRGIRDLLESLEVHLKLLQNYYVECFEKNNHEYFGEIAGKIRLLTKQTGNRPLLIGLMKEFEIEPTQIFDGPPVQYPEWHPKPGEAYTLETCLAMDSMGFRTRDDGFKLLSKSEFISLFAEKHGAAHEDWNHPEILRIIKFSNIYIGEEQQRINELKWIANWVLWAGKEFLSKLSEDLIEEVSNKRKLKVNYKDSIAHGKLGAIYLNQRKFKKAKRHLQKSCELNDDLIEAHWNLTCLYSLQKEYQNAIKHIKTISEKWGSKELEDLLKDSDLEQFINNSGLMGEVNCLLENG